MQIQTWNCTFYLSKLFALLMIMNKQAEKLKSRENEGWMNEGWVKDEWGMNEGWMKDEWRMSEGWVKDEWRMMKDEKWGELWH